MSRGLSLAMRAENADSGRSSIIVHVSRYRMFHVALFLVLAGSAVHVSRLADRTTRSGGEAILRWVLVGYCGLPIIAFMTFGLLRPQQLAELTGFPPGSPFQTFTLWALLGMGVAAALAVRLRGPYLTGPALAWAVFFVGATSIHLEQFSSAGELTHGAMLTILATHGSISVILLGSLWASRVWQWGASA